MRLVFFALAALCGLSNLTACGGCGGDTHDAGDPLRTIPIDVDGAFIVPSIGTLQQQTFAFLGTLEGASGVLELLADKYSIDLRTADGLTAAGLDPAHGAVVWTKDQAVVVAVPVRDAKAFGALVDTRLVRGLGATMKGTTPEAWAAPRIYDGPVPPGASTPEPAWRAAWGVSDDGIGIVAFNGPDVAPETTYQRALGERGGLASETAGRLAKAKSAAGDGAVAWIVARDVLPAVPDGLGMAKGLVEDVRSGLREWQGGLVMDGERLALRMAADYTGEGELPLASWVAPEGSADVIAQALPKTTTLMARFRLDLAKLRRMPSFILEQLVPDQIPGLDMLPIPALPDLIGMLTGDIGVALLGVEPNATLAGLTSVAKIRQRALETFRVALIARVHDVDAMRRAFGDIAQQMRDASWVVADIDPAKAAGWSGWTFLRGTTSYSVLMSADVIVFIVGPGEVDNFITARDGRATTLAAYGAGFDRTMKEALGLEPLGGGTAFGLSLGFLRLTRELADKGVPPYFLKMLNELRLVGMAIDAQPKRVTFALEVAR